MTTASLRALSVSAAALLAFAVIFIALHVLRRDLDPSRHLVSEYATGPWGFLMGAGFIVLGLAAGALLVALVPARPRSPFAIPGLLALAVLSIGTCIAAFYPMDLPGAPATPSGDMHVIDAQVNFVSAFASSLFLALAYRGDAGWRPFFPLALALSLAIFASFVLMIVAFEKDAAFGLANRLLALAIFAWLSVTVRRLRAKLA